MGRKITIDVWCSNLWNNEISLQQSIIFLLVRAYRVTGMANKVTVVQNSREVSNMADKEFNLSEEEQAFLREIRDEREHLAREIQVRSLFH